VEDEVWISEAPMRSENVKLTFHSFVTQDKVFDERFEFADASMKRNEAGEPLGPEHFPEHVYSNCTSQAAKQTFSDLFISRGYIVVSEAAARILRGIDLGAGALYPVRVTLADQQTPVGEGWYCLNFGNVQQSVVREESRGLMQARPGVWLLSAYRKAGDVAVSRDVIDGPDIWVDPRVVGGFFVSGRLGAMIEQARLTGFYLSKCRVI
jgi:hypothetical protein